MKPLNAGISIGVNPLHKHILLIGLLVVVIGIFGVNTVFAQSDDIRIEDVLPATADLEYTGHLLNDDDEHYYLIDLEADNVVIISMEQMDGFMDPYLYLNDPNDLMVGENDDFNWSVFDRNSLIVHVAEFTGKYTITVNNYPGYAGDYRLRVYFVDLDIAVSALDLSRLRLSGETFTIETEHFIVHYTDKGVDSATPSFAQAVAETMEEVYEIQITQLGWSPPPTDGILGGDDRYDVYLSDVLGYQGVLGFAQPEISQGDNPFTKVIEASASYAYFVLDNDFDPNQIFGDVDPIAMMRATAAHEFHHIIQFGYDMNDSHSWLYEGTASWMEIETFIEDEDASGYLPELFNYPEICFGADGFADPTGGGMRYASWLFFEFLTTEYSLNSSIYLWQNIREYDGFDAISETLALYDDTVEDAFIRFHIRNLLHDYDIAELMEDFTLKQEDIITRAGTFEYIGDGVQELATNVFRLNLRAEGVYRASLENVGNTDLSLWMVGINADQAEVFSLGQDSTLDTSGYEYVYLLVYNPRYDNNINDCLFADYDLNIQRAYNGINDNTEARYTFDASNFIPLQ